MSFVEPIEGPVSHLEPPTDVSRERLPNRRRLVRHRLEQAGHKLYLDIGYSPAGKALEIFCSGLATGSGLAGMLNHFARVVSVALQHGVPPEALAHALTGDAGSPDDPADLFGLVLETLRHNDRLPGLL